MKSKSVKKGLALRILMVVVLSAYALISLYPLIWMFFNSFKNNEQIFVTNIFGPPTSFEWTNYITAINAFNIFNYARNSAVVSIAVVGLNMVLALMFAYATARMDFKFANVFRTYVTTGMFIPVQIIMIPLVILTRNLRLNNSLLTLIIPYIAFQLPFATMVLYGFFRSIPNEIEEAATIDGASVYTTFAKIMVPIAKSAVASVIIFVFLYAWNEFYMALILIAKDSLKTLPLGLINFQGQFMTDWGAMAATMTIASLPTVIVYLFFSEQVEKALTVGSAVKG